MRRWNGWGDESITYEVDESAWRFIEQQVGPGRRPQDVTLEQTVAAVPASRLPEHPLVSHDPAARVLRSFGQSFPDWLAARTGRVPAYPDGVAFPQRGEDVAALLEHARSAGAVVIPYGGGTSVVGHLNAEQGGRSVLSLSLERMDRLLRVDAAGCLATFQAGVAGPELERALEELGFTLGHFPQSFELSTLGGWVTTRSSGHFSLRYGRIEDLYCGGEVQTPAGRLLIPAVPASAAGPDLRQLVMGSEGRLGVVTTCDVRISRRPESQVFHGAFLPGAEAGAAAVRELAQSGLDLTMMRLSFARETETSLELSGQGLSRRLLDAYLAVRRMGPGRCLLLYGATGPRGHVRRVLHEAQGPVKRHGGVVIGAPAGDRWYRTRFLYPYLRNTLWERGYAADTLETAVRWAAVHSTVRAIEDGIRRAFAGHDERVHVFTHLSHVYPHGTSIYTSYVFRLSPDPDETLARWRDAKAAASRAIVEHGGTISHQHGVGHDHRPYLEAEKGALGLRMIRAVIDELDPHGVMSSGNLIPAE